jgi:hypothetical protein
LRASTQRSVIVLNLGVAGTSNDYIARLLHLAIPILDPHIVLVNFTHATRRDYVSVRGTWTPYAKGHIPPDLAGREIKSHFEALCNPYDDVLNVFGNYKSVEALLADRLWLFSTMPSIGVDPFHSIRDHIDMKRHAGQLQTLDLARDCSHPGPKSHQHLADRYWERFCTQGRLRVVT